MSNNVVNRWFDVSGRNKGRQWIVHTQNIWPAYCPPTVIIVIKHKIATTFFSSYLQTKCLFPVGCIWIIEAMRTENCMAYLGLEYSGDIMVLVCTTCSFWWIHVKGLETYFLLVKIINCHWIVVHFTSLCECCLFYLFVELVMILFGVLKWLIFIIMLVCSSLSTLLIYLTLTSVLHLQGEGIGSLSDIDDLSSTFSKVSLFL